jgi:hypothetical protein
MAWAWVFPLLSALSASGYRSDFTARPTFDSQAGAGAELLRVFTENKAAAPTSEWMNRAHSCTFRNAQQNSSQQVPVQEKKILPNSYIF